MVDNYKNNYLLYAFNRLKIKKGVFSMMEFWNFLEKFVIPYIGYIVTASSTIFGVFQYRNKRRLERSIAHKVMALHTNIDMSLGAVQNAKGNIADNTDPLYQIGRCEGSTTAALVHCADIYCNLMKTSVDDIDEMLNKGVIRSDQALHMFKSSSEMRGSLWSRIRKLFT